MAFDVRCPSCQAKMRFDDPPRRGEPIVCPKCDTTFAAPAAAAFEEKKADEPKPAEGEKKPKKIKVIEAVPRTFFNHWLLLLIVGGSMFVISSMLFVVWLIVAKSAKAEDMLACVPDNFNVIQGVNVKALNNYPAVKQNGDRYYNQTARRVFKDVAGKLSIDPEEDLAYVIIAREAKTDNVLYLFGTTPKFDPDDLGGGKVTNSSYGLAVCPTRTLIAVASGPRAAAVLEEVAENARRKPWDGMHNKVGTCGKLASRGQIWAIWRDSGTLKGWLAGGADVIREDGMSKLSESLGKASVCASWVSFGSGGVRFNAGLELPSSSDASALVLDMKRGPLGKSDESTPPKGFKGAFNSISDVKTNGAFYQYLDFRQQGTCAFCQSKVDDPGKASGGLTEFVSSNRGIGPTGFAIPGLPGQ